MKKVKIYEYSKCSTCRNAIKFLQKKGVDCEVIPIVETPPSESELRKMLSFLGGELKRLFNTSGVQYREMGLSEKLKEMSVDQALKLLAKNGKLVKRPFLFAGDRGLVGFNEKEWTEFFRA